MKGKLVKNNHFYALQIDSDIIAVSLEKETEEHTVNYKHQLSLKNCQAIENGYDLYELAEEEYFKHESNDLLYGDSENEQLAYKAGIVDGFQKALEILGDKKFNEDDMKEAMLNTIELTDWQKDQFRKDGNYHMAIDIIQSLQQTEWEVEIVMDRIPADLAPDGWDVFPKLDADGCIILKRVE